MRETFTAYITKDALTKGIRRMEAKDCSFTSILVDEGSRFTSYHKGEWHRSLIEAKIAAEEMCARKRSSALRRESKS